MASKAVNNWDSYLTEHETGGLYGAVSLQYGYKVFQAGAVRWFSDVAMGSQNAARAAAVAYAKQVGYERPLTHSIQLRIEREGAIKDGKPLEADQWVTQGGREWVFPVEGPRWRQKDTHMLAQALQKLGIPPGKDWSGFGCIRETENASNQRDAEGNLKLVGILREVFSTLEVAQAAGLGDEAPASVPGYAEQGNVYDLATWTNIAETQIPAMLASGSTVSEVAAAFNVPEDAIVAVQKAPA